MAIRNQARRLLSLKEYRNDRRYSYRDIEEATGLSPTTISAVLNNTMQRYDLDMVARFCGFLECSVNEFFVEVNDEDFPEGQEMVLAAVPAA